MSEALSASQSVALTHCVRRLEKARAALEVLRSAHSFEETEIAWSDFLAAHHTVFAKLEQASKKDNTTRNWFNLVKNERRTDELLKYVHHARNSDEHGIEDVTVRIGRAHVIRFKNDTGKPMEINSRITIDRRGATFEETGERRGYTSVENIMEPSVILTKVVDSKYGDSFDPPSDHFGAAVNSSSPLYVAELAYDYLHKLVLVAEHLGI